MSAAGSSGAMGRRPRGPVAMLDAAVRAARPPLFASIGALLTLALLDGVDLRWACGAALAYAALHLAHTRLRRGAARDSWALRVAVVGNAAAAATAIERLRGDGSRNVAVLGRYADGPPDDGETPRGTLRTLLLEGRLGAVDAIVLAPDPGDAVEAERTRAALRPVVQPVYVMDAASGGARIGDASLQEVQLPAIRGWRGAAKRAIDIGGAMGLLLATAPLLLLVAAAVRLESTGPILFRQLRVGYNNQLFYILKFRSMHHGATDRLAKQQTVYRDARVTRVGRVIRRLSVDELPQLFNVLRGEMSLVGPRPHAPGTSIDGTRVHHLLDDYACRHRVRPGITGLAQVRGLRGGLQTRDQASARLQSDLEYVERWSLRLDIRVLLLTTVLELRGSHGC